MAKITFGIWKPNSFYHIYNNPTLFADMNDNISNHVASWKEMLFFSKQLDLQFLLGGRLNRERKSPKLALLEGGVISSVQNIILGVVVSFGQQYFIYVFISSNIAIYGHQMEVLLMRLSSLNTTGLKNQKMGSKVQSSHNCMLAKGI